MKMSIIPSKVVGIVGGMGPEAGVDLAYNIIGCLLSAEIVCCPVETFYLLSF